MLKYYIEPHGEITSLGTFRDGYWDNEYVLGSKDVKYDPVALCSATYWRFMTDWIRFRCWNVELRITQFTIQSIIGHMTLIYHWIGMVNPESHHYTCDSFLTIVAGDNLCWNTLSCMDVMLDIDLSLDTMIDTMVYPNPSSIPGYTHDSYSIQCLDGVDVEIWGDWIRRRYKIL